jgi:hypothetical protein
METTLHLKDLDPYIIGTYYEDGYFSFVIYANHAPRIGDIISTEKGRYMVESIDDNTEDEERYEGLRYSCVSMFIMPENPY